MFLTWKERAVSGCRSFISECKWEQISLTRNSRSLFSLVPSRHSRRHQCCHFAFAVLPMSAVAAVWTRPTPRSSEKITCVIPKLGLALRFFIYRQCGQYCHNLFSFGNWSLTWNTASIQHYRCRSSMFRHGTWGVWQTWGLSRKAFPLLSSIWSKKICSSYSISVSVPYSFHLQKF